MSASDELTTQAADTPSDERLARILAESKTIAVIGASTNAHKPAHGVPLYMQRHGYRVLPVNPIASGQELFTGECLYRDLLHAPIVPDRPYVPQGIRPFTRSPGPSAWGRLDLCRTDPHKRDHCGRRRRQPRHE